MRSTLTARLLGEGLGTLLLLATVIGSGIMGGTLSGGNVAIALLGNTVATGAVLVVLITMLGPISGAHFNPAVTLVMLMAREISVREAVLYVLVQVFAAVAGVWLAHAMFDLDIWQVSEKVRSGGGQWLSETVATFGLVTTILLTRRFRPDHVAVSVGLYITAAYWFTASTSFANPAVTLARSVSNTFAGIRPGDVAPFVAAQLLGMLLAWIVVRALLDSVSEKS
ncbi:aquaporin [Rhizobium terricola]|uniref:aquaporin n=1 Tax=Rhizobium terricola TaxID=2728849 RepID=UPI00197EE668|nr:MIP/aquaporin family protein [Rhizobium terricola]